jgi:hypothetical protein
MFLVMGQSAQQQTAKGWRHQNGTITADIATVDNSLVQRLKVDRHTGAIEYQD